jgi:hypothetical protein
MDPSFDPPLSAASRRCGLLPLTAALLAGWLLAPLAPAIAHAQPVEEWLDISGGLGSGIMRGGRGGLASAQRSPIFIDATALGVEDSWLLLGGSLRVELEDGRAVAAVPRAVLRHKMGAFELRPGAAIPFYFAPKTMLGPEADLGLRLGLKNGFGLIANAGIAAFMIGNDVPHGTTVVMFNLQLGVDLFL